MAAAAVSAQRLAAHVHGCGEHGCACSQPRALLVGRACTEGPALWRGAVVALREGVLLGGERIAAVGQVRSLAGNTFPAWSPPGRCEPEARLPGPSRALFALPLPFVGRCRASAGARLPPGLCALCAPLHSWCHPPARPPTHPACPRNPVLCTLRHEKHLVIPMARPCVCAVWGGEGGSQPMSGFSMQETTMTGSQHASPCALRLLCACMWQQQLAGPSLQHRRGLCFCLLLARRNSSLLHIPPPTSSAPHFLPSAPLADPAVSCVCLWLLPGRGWAACSVAGQLCAEGVLSIEVPWLCWRGCMRGWWLWGRCCCGGGHWLARARQAAAASQVHLSVW